jgi:hypothetical protein
MKLSTIFVSIVLGLSAFSLLYAAYPSVSVTSSIAILEKASSVSVGLSTATLVSNSVRFVSGGTRTTTVMVSTTLSSCTVVCDRGTGEWVCDAEGHCFWVPCSRACWSQAMVYRNVYTSTSGYNTYAPLTYSETLTLFSSTSYALTAQTQYTTRAIPLYQLYGLNGVQIAAVFVFVVVTFLLYLHYKWNSLHNPQLQGAPKILVSHPTD